MRFACVIVALAAVAALPAHAAPVDAVVVWTPGVDREPIAAAARGAGVAALDRTPAVPESRPLAPIVAQAIDAYDGLRFDAAWQALELARTVLDATGGGDAATATLTDVFVYRALVRTQANDLAAAWDEWITAVTIDPTRALDPARFAPRVVADLERARQAVVARARVPLSFTGADGCAVTIDGGPAAERNLVLVGAHWIRVSCAGAAPWGQRVVATEGTTAIALAARRVTAPTDDELLVAMRSTGVSTFVSVVVRDQVVWLRRVGADGRVRASRTVAIADGADAVARVLAPLLAPSPPPARWYRSRWAWAAGAALATAAIAVPLVLVISGDDAPTTATVIGPGGAL